MRRKKQIVSRLTAFAFAILLALPMCMTAFAADEYDPLTVELPYRHLYTTTDTGVDDLFHYIITPEDEAPLPAEADSNGVFTYKGTSGAGVADGNKTVFDLEGKLTFTFTKPGKYVYTITGDQETDGKKENADRYYFESRIMTATFFIINEPGSQLKLKMLTAEDTQEDVKVNEIELDPTYEGPEPTPTPTETPAPTPTETPEPTATPEPTSTPQPTSTPIPEPSGKDDDHHHHHHKWWPDKKDTGPKDTGKQTVKPTSATPKNGDSSSTGLYASALVAAAGMMILLVQMKKRKGSEHNA